MTTSMVRSAWTSFYDTVPVGAEISLRLLEYCGVLCRRSAGKRVEYVFGVVGVDEDNAILGQPTGYAPLWAVSICTAALTLQEKFDSLKYLNNNAEALSALVTMFGILDESPEPWSAEAAGAAVRDIMGQSCTS